jgi:hypothetical protein
MSKTRFSLNLDVDFNLKKSHPRLIMPSRRVTRKKTTRRSNARRRISNWNATRVQPLIRGRGWMSMLKKGATFAAKAAKAAASNPLIQQAAMQSAMGILQGRNIGDTLKGSAIDLKNNALEQYAGIPNPSGSGRRRRVPYRIVRRPRGKGLNTGGRKKKARR